MSCSLQRCAREPMLSVVFVWKLPEPTAATHTETSLSFTYMLFKDQNLMGITGPSYKLVHGNTKEIISMKMKTMRSPRNLSNDILSTVQPHIHSWTKIFGKNFLLWYGPQPQLIIAQPELCKEILNNNDRNYRKQKSQGYTKKLLGDSISMADGEKWIKLRKLANHGESF